MTSDRIPVAAPDLNGREAEYVLAAVKSSWISSTGPYVERFEREFAEFAGTRTAISVANGTAALHLAMLALGVGHGDEVIVPSLTYIATANAVRYVGAEPVFVDVDPETWCIDVAAAEAAVTARTRGLIAVHLYGHPADMDALADLAKRHGMWIVEDAAEAHGAKYKGRPVGSLAEVATFSFYGNKLITSGEGGALTTSDQHLEDRVRLLRGQGVDTARRYQFKAIGYNYRLTNVACALLCAQLERFSELWDKRRQIYDWYESELAGLKGIALQPKAGWAKPAPWLFSITINQKEFGRGRDELMAFLDSRGIETRPFFPPVHRQAPYQGRGGVRASLPVTDDIASRGLNLPTHPGLEVEDIKRIAVAMRQFGE